MNARKAQELRLSLGAREKLDWYSWEKLDLIFLFCLSPNSLKPLFQQLWFLVLISCQHFPSSQTASARLFCLRWKQRVTTLWVTGESLCTFPSAGIGSLQRNSLQENVRSCCPTEFTWKNNCLLLWEGTGPHLHMNTTRSCSSSHSLSKFILDPC